MKIKRLEFANVIAPKNLKHYQDKINEIVDWINEQNENRGIGGKNGKRKVRFDKIRD